MASEKLFKGGLEIQNGAFVLTVSRDRLKAFAVPKDAAASARLDLELLGRELEEQGIMAGMQPIPDEAGGHGALVVAKGFEPVAGENARVHLHVKPGTSGTQQAEDKGGEPPRIVNVAKGKLLLEKIAPTLGKAGQDVFGTGIPSKPGKDSSLKYGKGVEISSDQMQIFATIDGKFVMEDGKPTVSPEHTVAGDIGVKTGDVIFGGGNLTISGEVLPGFNVKCRGDIKIVQGVSNSLVMAGGTLSVTGGVVGEETVLRSRGDLEVEFVENGPRLETAGILRIKDVFMQGHASVGKEVIATQGKGLVVGGRILAGGSLHVKDLGNDDEVTTEVCVGLIPSLSLQKQKIDEDLDLWSGRLNEIVKNISTLEKIKKESGGKLPEEKGNTLAKYKASMPKLMGKVDELIEQDKALDLELEQMTNESVYVYGHLFPGVVVKIGNVVRTITVDEERAVIYYDRENRQILVRKMTSDEQAAMPA